mmetsp:Transcript_39059/g.110624  ORF Transcript_39059/g.110624 Transcript_39059/m.110624 type:complete len:778 (-) Transcript_39059:102-2435(-)
MLSQLLDAARASPHSRPLCPCTWLPPLPGPPSLPLSSPPLLPTPGPPPHCRPPPFLCSPIPPFFCQSSLFFLTLRSAIWREGMTCITEPLPTSRMHPLPCPAELRCCCCKIMAPFHLSLQASTRTMEGNRARPIPSSGSEFSIASSVSTDEAQLATNSIYDQNRLLFPELSDDTLADFDDADFQKAMSAALDYDKTYQKMMRMMNQGKLNTPSLNICIMVVGTHGDVSPFCALGKHLQASGHRVRIATHAAYRKLVQQESGLEFYPLAGDPAVLSEFMVKTGGKLIPDSLEAIEGLPTKIEMMRDIIFSSYPAATRPDPDGKGEGVPGEPFVANAIISNPPVYGHQHVAEALQVPLHLMFPQPWVPTNAFPHPLACIDSKRKRFSYKNEWSRKNKMSYFLVQRLELAGMGGLLNSFRLAIGLPTVPALELDRLAASTFYKVPFVHMWSPAFVPKPPDWGPLVDVVGNFFSSNLEDSKWDPPADLAEWLAAGEKPILVTYGSMKFSNAETLTHKFYKSADRTGARILLQSGWSHLGVPGVDPKDHGCFIMGRAPHDWLMQQCSGVIHHGGAGTCAAGLRCGLPTFICPFFGDQHFWGEMVYRAGVGPRPHLIGDLLHGGATKILVEALQTMRDPAVIAKAQAIAKAFEREDGVKGGADAFHRHLPVERMSCQICLYLVFHKHLERPRRAVFTVSILEDSTSEEVDKHEYNLDTCTECLKVLKEYKASMQEKISYKLTKYQKWSIDGPVASSTKSPFLEKHAEKIKQVCRRYIECCSGC